ncbi:M56 family metallopeptidase [Nocardioides gilvus]|uniref:M56 family metallopeptidase n=1 Tax=Nocardioides gilvus TaxID=1735589 RepID=UPI000D749649|nr:M56 family metallopeptidase [Nocardioides gilvus]
MITPFVLGLLAVALAGPVPALMARWRGLHHTPFVAMLLWQSVALAGVLAAVGAGLSLFTHTTGTSDLTWRTGPITVLTVLITVTVVGRLLLSGHLVGTSLRVVRRQQRQELDLLAEWRGRVRVVEHDVPVAYCVPSVTEPRVVVSDATLTRLDEGQLNAVFAHERAHLTARHDLVLEAFTVLHRAFPRWVSSDAALREVRLLAEILADRAALRVAPAKDLGGALLAMATGRTPEGAMGASTVDLVERVRLLGELRPRPAQTVLIALLGWAVLVLPTGLVVAPWLTAL